MTRNRTIITLLLSGLMLLALTGCDGKKDDLPKATPSSGGTPETVAPYVATPSSTDDGGNANG